MVAATVVKTIGTTGVFSTPQLWDDGAPASLTTAEKSAATTFLVAAFSQGESLTFVGSGATGTLLDTDSTGAGTGTYVTYGITAGDPAASDVVTGGTSGATCVLTSGTADNVGVIWRGECQNQEFSGAGTQLTIAGSTASTTAYKELTAVAGASFRDNVNAQTNALQYNASNGCGIRGTSASNFTVSVTEARARINNLQISATGTGGRPLSATNANRLDSLILEGLYVATSASIGVLHLASTGVITNSVVIQRASAADHIVSTSTGTPSFFNCTFVAPDDHVTAPVSIFLSGASGTVTVQNCGMFAGDSTKAIVAGAATFNFTTCYSDISGTAGVTQATYADEFENVNDATRDFRLKTGAAQIDTGTTDATNAANDIVGTARPSGAAYDVGCWEFVIAVAYLRPDADDGIGGWTTQSGSTSNLFDSINETSPDDADYIISSADPSGDIYRASLSDLTATIEDGTLRYRYEKTGTATASLTVRLVQGASTVIATWTDVDVSTSFATVAQTLTTPQFEAITDFDDLFIELEASIEVDEDMALVAINRGFYFPYVPADWYSFGTNATLDAATEKYAMIGQVHITGRPGGTKTLSTGTIQFLTGTTTWANGGSTIDIGIQGVATGAGPIAQPDGTYSVKTTLTGGAGLSSSAWNTATMNSGTVNLSHGQMIAVVWDMTARAGVDSVVVRPQGSTSAFPTTNIFLASAWQTAAGLGASMSPLVVIVSDDGTVVTIEGCLPFLTGSTDTFSNSTNPDERGMLFQLPFNCKIDALFAMAGITDAASDFTMKLYSSPQSSPTEIASVAVLAENMTVLANNTMYQFTLGSEVALSKNTDYAVTILATGTTNARLLWRTLGAAGHRVLMPGGTTLNKVTRDGSTGNFALEGTPTTMYLMGVKISQFHAGA